ncbi:MAG: cupin-like domain-containing protein [Burkholderiales bacterium]|nr:cupin-like domain-containing protein [Burkholderiales bacterium]
MRAGKRKNHGQTQARTTPEGRTHAGAAVTMPAPRAEAVAGGGVEAAVIERPPVAPLPRAVPLGVCPPPLIVPQQTRPLDEQWATWILDNSLRRCTPQSMLATVTQAGIDPAQANAFINNLPLNPMYRAAERMRDKYDRFARVMHNVQAVHESAPDYTHVEKRSRVSREEFLERYVRGCRPVVLTDMARDWPAMQRWSFAEFKRRYGSMTVQVQAGRESDADFEVNKVKHRRDTNFAAFLDRVSTSGVTNDEYLTANNELLRRPEFMGLLDEVGPLPDICDQSMLKRAASLWIGPAGTRTPLHHDTLMLLHTQIVGRKRWRFVSPLSGPHLYNEIDVYSPVDFENLDLQRFPDAAKVKVLDVVVEPGETMFLPLAWWHQVTSLDKCISLSFTNMDFPNTFDFGHNTAMK